MEKSILITQCLQNDFVKPIEKYEPLPNRLHVGYDEALRLLGAVPLEGSVNTVIRWAYGTDETELRMIHIRDWHDMQDQDQKTHLDLFGHHCIQNSSGARFVFSDVQRERKNDVIINASGLNDFVDTNLGYVLDQYKNYPLKVGIMGVWTEAKVRYLAYDLISRYPHIHVVVCSALCASSSRTMHFISLEHLKNILGVEIFSSIGSFTKFLTGQVPRILKIRNQKLQDQKIHPADALKSAADKELLLNLFRNASIIKVKVLDGGFSGNIVLKGEAIDLFGHKEKPAVLKIGSRELIAKERMAFERIENVLGNNAPSIVDFVEIGDRGAIKYRYASMLDENVRSFQKLYAEENDLDSITNILKIVFKDHLGRLYDASRYEKLDLLKYYDFSARYARSVREKVETILKARAEGEYLTLTGGVKTPNICVFYEEDLLTLTEYTVHSHYTAYVHGDLNGANIIIDGQNNVWLIDFFHTHQGHILKDLIKLENDILYIFMKIETKEAFLEAVQLIDLLLDVQDVAQPLDPNKNFTCLEIRKAYSVIHFLRSFYPTLVHADRDPYQLYAGIMRYSVHTLSFYESNEYQKQLALYTSGLAYQKIKAALLQSRKLRIDFLKTEQPELNNLGITILPGRKDRERDLDEDILVLKQKGINTILSLITDDELIEYGVSDLSEKYTKQGLAYKNFPVLDQSVPTIRNMKKLIRWIREKLQKGEKVLVHCVGGLGRSGTIVACLLLEYGYSWQDAVKIVRNSRSKRAIETVAQMNFVESYSLNREKHH
ncbi:isochorismatase family protein [candidate division CSSED10-310 bacterium]|uniref:Isochorismatase family protein n=1 Tax=candidate division CSSED10-310 bacterium TaxID=2855610 RepID=A0ABV6YUC4_UNCC1